MMALSEDGGVSQRCSASAPVFDLKELFFSPCLPSTHPMTFARSVFPFRFLIRHIYFCSQWSLCFGSVTQHNWNGKKKKKLFRCLSKRLLNTSNKGSSAWKSRPNLSLSRRERAEGLQKLFQLQHWSVQPYLIENAQWFANCLENWRGFVCPIFYVWAAFSGQESNQFTRGRDAKRKQHLWAWKARLKKAPVSEKMKESVFHSVCSIDVHEWLSAFPLIKHKPHTGEFKRK